MMCTATRYWRRSRLAALAMLVSCPLLIAGLTGLFQWLAVSFLPRASINICICSPWITGPYNMHAAARMPG